MSRTTRLALALVPLLVPALVVAQQQTERVDLNVIHRIKTAEFGGGGGGGGRGGRGQPASHVMDIMFHLTDQYGPRLTNSPQFRAAGNWAVGQLKEWGLSNVRLEPWSTTDVPSGPIPSWELTSYSGAMVEPGYMPLIGLPSAWTAGTNGPVTADAVLAQVQTPDDLAKWHGKLRGKIVLISGPAIELPFPLTAIGHRYTGSELTEMMPDLIPGDQAGRGRGGRGGALAALMNMTPEQRQEFQNKMRSFWKDEGVVATVSASAVNDGGGTVRGGGAVRTGDPTQNIPAINIAAEHYNRMARLLEHNIPVKLMFDIKTKFDMSQTESFNVVAEIPGTTKPDELVMVGGHFDSWHYGTGATDNGVGSAVAMEVMRILKSLNLKMDRTVRMALWGGEEEGLLGSRAYVKAHFADPAVMKPTAEHDGFAGYFNIDNGTGRIRGIYLQGNEMVRPIFEQWFAAVKDLTEGTITIRNTGGTDHQSFDAVGLPGFQFIQDPMDYETRTHHTNMDTYDRLQAGDLEQMAVIEAAFVYNAATRAEKLPRKDLPAPQPAGRGGRGGD